jgi:hypothetical protein
MKPDFIALCNLIDNVVSTKSLLLSDSEYENLEACGKWLKSRLASGIHSGHMRVKWKEGETDSGLITGSVPVEKFGYLIGTSAVPVGQGALTVIALVKKDGENTPVALPAGGLEFVETP